MALFVFAASHVSAATADIRPAPGGERLLFVDGDDIRPTPGGKRLLFIDGDDIRPAPGGERLLFVDGSDVRKTPGGKRLLFLDGDDIRKFPGAKRRLFIDGGQDIRPAPGGERLYFIDGAKLSRAQLVAVLYLLKPELFKELSDAEIEAERIPEEAGDPTIPEGERLDQPQDWTGSYASADGSETLKAEKKGDFYAVTVGRGGKTFSGIGRVADDGGFLVSSGAETKYLGIVEFKVEGLGSLLKGEWIAFDAIGKTKNVAGYENLSGTADWLTDKQPHEYDILSAASPNTQQEYKGKCKITPLPDKPDKKDAFIFEWTIPGLNYKIYAFGFRMGDVLAASCGGNEGYTFGYYRFVKTTLKNTWIGYDGKGTVSGKAELVKK